PASAEARYRKILVRHPECLPALGGLGGVLLRRRQFEEAVGVWQRAAALDPANAHFAFQLARAYHRSGQQPAAIEMYFRVLTLDASFEKAIATLEQFGARLGSAHGLELGQGVEEAIQIAERLCLVSSSGASAARSIGRVVSTAGAALVLE